MNLVQDPNVSIRTIEHKILVDSSDFGVIESAAQKCSHIFGPEDWLDV